MQDAVPFRRHSTTVPEDIAVCLRGRGYRVFSREENFNPCVCRPSPNARVMYEMAWIRLGSVFDQWDRSALKHRPAASLALQEAKHAAYGRTDSLELLLDSGLPWRCSRGPLYVWDLFVPFSPCPTCCGREQQRGGDDTEGTDQCLGDAGGHRHLTATVWNETRFVKGALAGWAQGDSSALPAEVTLTLGWGGGERSMREAADIVDDLEHLGYRLWHKAQVHNPDKCDSDQAQLVGDLLFWRAST